MTYYKQVAEMLGVELEEEFILKENKTKNICIPRYKITQEEGLMFSVNRNEFARSTILLSIINGSYSVVKLPWKPKNDETYWWYSMFSKTSISGIFTGSTSDLIFWKAGNCFKTEKEANAKGKEIMEAIQKEYEEA